MAEFARMIDETTEGQQMELRWVVENDWGMSEADYYLMCTKKTSWYTVISPMRLGGFVAGAPPSSVESLVEPGKKLGVGFQIHDDVLNLSAGSKYGKETADDLLEGKRTLILIKLLSAANPQDKARIVEIFSMSRDGEAAVHGRDTGPDSQVRRPGLRLRKVDGAGKRRPGHAEECALDGRRSAARRIEEIARFAVERDW